MDAPHSETELFSDFMKLTCPTTEMDKEAVYTRPRKHNRVRSSLFRVLGEQPLDTDLGILERFPHEIKFYIARKFDLKSALRFSHANRAARDLLNGCKEYRLVGQHAPECVWAFMRTDLAKCTTVTAVYSALVRQRCVSCRRFGGLIFLPTAERVCFTCVQTRSLFRLYYLQTIHDWFSAGGVQVPEKEAIGTITCPPGFHNGSKEPKEARAKFISEFHAFNFAEANGMSVLDESVEEGSQGYIEPNDPEPLDGDGDSDLETPAVDLEFADADQEIPPHLQLEEDEEDESALGEPAPNPLLASCMLPYFNRKTHKAFRGRSCRGCKNVWEDLATDENLAARERAYLVDGFWKHFQKCDEAQRLMATDEEETEGETVTSEEETEGELSSLEEEIEDELSTLGEEIEDELSYLGEDLEDELSTLGEDIEEHLETSEEEETEEERVSDSEYVTAEEW
ncbi:unnamed protein product [Clonostachys rhizophaga]|uniref:F-box domain-containing protein n=1 Tax=Clonostachys rhizophaga TaxID=160324 RepID=A0A9N9VE07_9HYPO|nr:unnamed protein product [Clonostachys rhizophaga]